MASTIRGSDNFDSAGVGKNASAGSVGSYAFAYYTGSVTTGSTVAASNLKYASTGDYGGMFAFTATGGQSAYVSNANGAPVFYNNSQSMSGTWRAMGNALKDSTYGSTVSLWLRIS